MRKPKIIICRHAESVEDVDNEIYRVMEDLQVPLTDKGIIQAQDFGTVLSGLFNAGQRVRFYASPGVRNMQTLKIVIPKLPDNISIQVEVEPLIVKQDWGKITPENIGEIEADRYKTGVLRYTFPTGESAGSMMARLTLFKEKISKIQREEKDDIVVFSHGFEFRVLLMIIFEWSEELFESFGGLKNCEYRILTLEKDGEYSINQPLRKHGLPITRLLN